MIIFPDKMLAVGDRIKVIDDPHWHGVTGVVQTVDSPWLTVKPENHNPGDPWLNARGNMVIGADRKWWEKITT